MGAGEEEEEEEGKRGGGGRRRRGKIACTLFYWRFLSFSYNEILSLRK
jgi:hypothetical protein